MMRLQKFLASAGVASRRAAEELISEGKIKINGKVITKLGTSIDENLDVVEFQNKKITLPQDKIYIALHKPVGYICSTSDEQGETVLSLVKSKQRIFPVGRLDKDSSGLIILTNDGEFANRLTHPRYGSEKEYFVTLDRDLKEEDVKKIQRGMVIDGKRLRSVKVNDIRNKSAKFILQEGINRQIRRMLGKLGYTVIKLKRVRIGNLELGDLKIGQSKNIHKEDVG
ncbi:MAG: rRNA pseudouridine synthase [Candidatus Buchananbacteria bacterium]|nr:rRNA pseudouridine synthase [Candidatus Buchananbacteria bacterium]